jgi:hypothetical protein
VREDAALELAQRRAGLEPELLGEAPAGGGEHLERGRLAARAVERQGEGGEQPLAEWVLGCQPLQLGHELVPEAAREVGLDAVLQRRDPPVLQVAGGSSREGL